jgi:catechol 2,3-dioxygenase-like lactoylglutathione lyase family enzyme
MAPFANIDHVAIVVKNMAQSIRFYSKHLGFAVEREFGNKELGIRAVVLKRKRSRIELFEYKSNKPGYAKNIRRLHGAKVDKSYFEPGLKHIAFRTDKFRSVVASLEKSGVKPWIKPKKGYSGDSITFFQDPNGILLEMVSPLGRKKKK